MKTHLIKLADLPDDPKPYQFRMLDRESLDAIEYTLRHWCCQAKGCTRTTAVRDYGMAPWYWLDRNSKWSRECPDELWRNMNRNFRMCSKHWKLWQRLLQLYGFDATWNKICKPECAGIIG